MKFVLINFFLSFCTIYANASIKKDETHLDSMITITPHIVKRNVFNNSTRSKLRGGRSDYSIEREAFIDLSQFTSLPFESKASNTLQVQLFPDGQAVVFERKHMTYEEETNLINYWYGESNNSQNSFSIQIHGNNSIGYVPSTSVYFFLNASCPATK